MIQKHHQRSQLTIAVCLLKSHFHEGEMPIVELQFEFRSYAHNLRKQLALALLKNSLDAGTLLPNVLGLSQTVSTSHLRNHKIQIAH